VTKTVATSVPVSTPSPSPFQSGGPEQVVYCHDEPSGLRAIIAIHSTALGPALGGTRFHPYPTEAEALADVRDGCGAVAQLVVGGGAPPLPTTWAALAAWAMNGLSVARPPTTVASTVACSIAYLAGKQAR